MITGGLINVVPVPKRRNQFTSLPRQKVLTPHGPVHFARVQQSHRHIGNAGDLRPSAYIADPHEALWLYVIHNGHEYIGQFLCAPGFTDEQITQTATDFASSNIAH